MAKKEKILVVPAKVQHIKETIRKGGSCYVDKNGKPLTEEEVKKLLAGTSNPKVDTKEK